MQNLMKQRNKRYTILSKLLSISSVRSLDNHTICNIKCENLTWRNEKSRLLIPLSFHVYKQMHREFHAMRALFIKSNNETCLKFNTARHFSTSSVIRSSDNKSDKKQNEENKNKDDKEKEEEKMKEEMEKKMQFLIKLATIVIVPFITYFGIIYMFKYDNSSSMDISWQEFVYDMLLKGEVQRIRIIENHDCALIELYPDTYIRGRRAHRLYRLKVSNMLALEDRIRQVEEEHGIKPEDSIPVVYSHSDAQVKLFCLTLFLFALYYLRRATRNIGVSFNAKRFLDDMFNRRAHYTLIDPKTKKEGGVRFSDVAGLKEAKIEVMEFVDHLKNRTQYSALGGRFPSGALLLGPPGCGKTLLAKAVAFEAGVPFLSMNGSEFIEMVGGLGASRVRDLFAQARKRAPSIIYIDEIDAIGKKRRINVEGHDELGQTLNQLLVELDGMSSRSDVILLGSTNRADVLDRALLRPGRFDRLIEIDYPTYIEREEIFQIYLKSIKLEGKPEQYSGYYAHLTPGFTGADIANVCNEAAIAAATHKKQYVTDIDLTNAIDKVTFGTRKKSVVMSPFERRVLAYREAGRVLVGWLSEYIDTFIKASITPTTAGRLGVTQFKKLDLMLYSKEHIFAQMCLNVASRVSENIIFDNATTGSERELKNLTSLAYAQVRVYGMNKKVGLFSFTKDEFNRATAPFSKKFKSLQDFEARQIVMNAYNVTEALLRKNRHKLDKIAEELLKRDSLKYEDIERLIGPPPFGKKKILSYQDYLSNASKVKEPNPPNQSAEHKV